MSSLQRALDAAIARENANPQGLPQKLLDGMEADILANPERYPNLSRLLAPTESMRTPHRVRHMRHTNRRFKRPS